MTSFYKEFRICSRNSNILKIIFKMCRRNSNILKIIFKGSAKRPDSLSEGEVLEHLTNVSAAANEEIKSYVHEEISGVISLAQDMQEKLQHLENNLQGLSRETAQCLKGEDLETLD
ncbi:uncharacterized protein [Palaemon carinicauda]|uniref:uncharacterized protein n=1 Tax=Palaemon carinicauda TaxID=392227 RepID=UPI0035B6A727